MGQKQISLQSRDFCTLHAVDIPLLVHRRGLDFFAKRALCAVTGFFENRDHWFTPKRVYTK